MGSVRDRAIALRKQGYSYNLIHQKTGAPKSTMHYWFKDIPFEPNEEVRRRISGSLEKNSRRKREARAEETAKLLGQGMRELGELSSRDIWLLGLGLYIGEGAKTTEAIRISNSDPLIIKLSIRWLKEICGLDDGNLRVRLHLYPDTDVHAATSYWQEVTGLPEENFQKVSIDIRKDKRRAATGKLPYGTAHVSARTNGNPELGVRLYRRLNGWMWGALQQM